jgi:hypothetical protein
MRQDAPNPPSASLARRLERGELVEFAESPFALPHEEEIDFLCSLELSSRTRKHVTFNPVTEEFSGVSLRREERRLILKRVLSNFSRAVCDWLKEVLPEYTLGTTPDRVTFRTEEEAVRTLRFSARNDLLHIDSFPNRPTFGKRILRVYLNLNPTDDRVWSVSERYESLLDRYRKEHRLPSRTRDEWVSIPSAWHRLLQGDWVPRSRYDEFQLKLHHFLKRDDRFQDRASRTYRRFPPRSCWLLFSDGLAHADLRGRFAVEHSFFVSPRVLTETESSPLEILTRASNESILSKVG